MTKPESAPIRIATWLIWLGAVVCCPAFAAVGTVSQLAGTLSVRKADGSVRLLSHRSEIGEGDIIDTQRDSYAQIRFSDGARITLKPNTSLKIVRFNFAANEPQDDAFVYSLLRGGLRVVSGMVGTRGDPEAHRLITSAAVIGVKGADLGHIDCSNSEFCLGRDALRVTPGGALAGTLLAAAGRAGTFSVDDCSATGFATGGCAALDPGVYVAVSDGGISIANPGGNASLFAGQAAAIGGPERSPRFLAIDPGLQFTPPASFVQSLTGGSAVNAGRSLECVIRR